MTSELEACAAELCELLNGVQETERLVNSIEQIKVRWLPTTKSLRYQHEYDIVFLLSEIDQLNVELAMIKAAHSALALAAAKEDFLNDD